MKVKILPPTFFMIFLLFSIVLHFIFPVKKIIYPSYNYLGIILIMLGVVLNIWSDALFKRDNTTVKPYENPAKLQIQGPFRISRHPMYLGMAMALLGLAIFLGSLITFIVPIAFIIVADFIFISFEEKNLEQIFGKKYLDYKQKVRRWL